MHSIPPYFSKFASVSVYNHYPSLRIVIENYHPLMRTSCNQAGLFNSQHTCNTVPSVSYKRPSYSFASTISTCCSAWAWDHDCHITVYDAEFNKHITIFTDNDMHILLLLRLAISNLLNERIIVIYGIFN